MRILHGVFFSFLANNCRHTGEGGNDWVDHIAFVCTKLYLFYFGWEFVLFWVGGGHC